RSRAPDQPHRLGGPYLPVRRRDDVGRTLAWPLRWARSAVWALTVIVLALASGASQPARAQSDGGTVAGPDMREEVWYEIFVRSFQDSDGDGVGDLDGVRSRLPYLADLGVGGIWLMPIHPS